MPKQPATTFTDFITAAAAKIPDPALASQFTSTFGQFLAQQPSTVLETLDLQTNNNVLLHRDYSRIVSEQRAEAAALAQREQELQHLQANAVARSEYDQLQQQLTEIRNRAQWVDTLRTRLDEMDLTELVLDSDEVQQFRGLSQLASSATTPEDNQMPDPATPNGNGQQPPAGTPMPQWVNGQWYLPMTAPAAAQPQYQPAPAQPAAAAAAPDFEALVNARVQAALGEVLPAALAQVYGASSQTALEMQGFAAEWKALKGEDIDPRQLNQEFVNSGKQFNEFLEDRFKLSEAREAKRTTDFQSAVDAAAEQKLQQRLAEMTTAGSLRNGIPSNPGSTPLFDAIAARPNGLRQAYTSPGSNVSQQPLTPQAAPAATTVPQQQPATPPPNPADTTGLEAAAAALASGRFANSRFDPTRPMGAPGMA
jgi:hypothetical protein